MATRAGLGRPGRAALPAARTASTVDELEQALEHESGPARALGARRRVRGARASRRAARAARARGLLLPHRGGRRGDARRARRPRRARLHRRGSASTRALVRRAGVRAARASSASSSTRAQTHAREPDAEIAGARLGRPRGRAARARGPRRRPRGALATANGPVSARRDRAARPGTARGSARRSCPAATRAARCRPRPWPFPPPRAGSAAPSRSGAARGAPA